MKNVPENELFSAYLDGELTAAEQTQVEQLLQSSPSARQLLDELRALGTALQTLPQQLLGEDLSEKVLHLAERRILGGEIDSARPSPARLPAVLRRMASPRAIAWSATVVGVAVLLMIFNPDRPGENNELARHEADDAAEGDAGPAMRAVGKREDRFDVADSEEEADAVDDATGAIAGGMLVADDTDPSALPPDAASEVEPPATGPARPYYGKGAGPFKSAGGRAMSRQAPGGPGPMAAPSPAAPPPADLAERGGGSQFREHVPGMGSDDQMSEGVAADSNRDQPRQTVDLPSRPGGPELMKIPADQRPDEPSRYSGQIPRGVAVIRLGISREAAENRTFDSLLPVHGIVWEKEPARRSAAGPSATATPKDGGRQKVRGAVTLRLSREAAAWRLARQLRQEGAEVVDVVATRGQVEAALADLASRESDFPTISIDPAPGDESQKTWTKYNRIASTGQQKALPDAGEVESEPDTVTPIDAPRDARGDMRPNGPATNGFARQEIGSQAAGIQGAGNQGAGSRSSVQTPKGVARRVRLPGSGRAGQPTPGGQTLQPGYALAPPAIQAAPATAPLVPPTEPVPPVAGDPTPEPGNLADVSPKLSTPPPPAPAQGESIDQKAPSAVRQPSVASNGQTQVAGQPFQYEQTQQRYRVLFVLRDVGGRTLPSAATRVEPVLAEPPVESSEVEVPSNAPAAEESVPTESPSTQP